MVCFKFFNLEVRNSGVHPDETAVLGLINKYYFGKIFKHVSKSHLFCLRLEHVLPQGQVSSGALDVWYVCICHFSSLLMTACIVRCCRCLSVGNMKKTTELIFCVTSLFCLTALTFIQ